MNEQDSKRFMYLQGLWCQIREQGLATKNKAEKEKLRERMRQINREQDELLEKWKENTPKNGSYGSLLKK
jgi:hypothetical protein